MVLAKVTVTLLGRSGFRIGTTNSSTLFSLGFTASETGNPSLGLIGFLNLPCQNLSERDPDPSPSLRNPYAFLQTAGIHLSG